MSEDRTLIVCSLVTDMPEPHVRTAEKRWCSMCAEEVWMAPSSLTFMAETGHLPICAPCAAGVVETEDEPPHFGPVPGAQARHELEEYS